MPEPINLREEYGKNNPVYNGHSWRVAGKQNEAICASAIYCYSSTNVEFGSQGVFCRQTNLAKGDVERRGNLYDWRRPVFALSENSSGIQYMGNVANKEGKLITFLNILQHEVQGFALNDRTKPGHHKMLQLFLVDPNVGIISTADIPPQRLDRWHQGFLEEHAKGLGQDASLLHTMPAELQDEVFSIDDLAVESDLEKTKDLRQRVEQERDIFARALQLYSTAQDLVVDDD
ncbi:hypothetical protein DFP72DRAFT_1151581 [Ephemerocybe angulata]|uniref:DUF4246 domain-containing protein n=1 Tax=Ephemerocybe angulata TaxID=980116 RepID=A0A8H6ICJ5_9AGAR|nr:hypothetical protein DFP72DRAFT_1151581 [Tulosesus angulatus]